MFFEMLELLIDIIFELLDLSVELISQIILIAVNIVFGVSLVCITVIYEIDKRGDDVLNLFCSVIGGGFFLIQDAVSYFMFEDKSSKTNVALAARSVDLVQKRGYVETNESVLVVMSELLMSLVMLLSDAALVALCGVSDLALNALFNMSELGKEFYPFVSYTDQLYVYTSASIFDLPEILFGLLFCILNVFFWILDLGLTVLFCLIDIVLSLSFGLEYMMSSLSFVVHELGEFLV